MGQHQPLRILFVRTPAGKARLRRLMAEGNRAKTLSAPAAAILAVDCDFHDRIPELFPFRPELRDRYTGDAAEREGAATFNGGLQAG